MSDNALLAVIIIVGVTSCTAASYIDHSQDPVTACVKAAWTNAGRVECLRAKEPK